MMVTELRGGLRYMRASRDVPGNFPKSKKITMAKNTRKYLRLATVPKGFYKNGRRSTNSDPEADSLAIDKYNCWNHLFLLDGVIIHLFLSLVYHTKWMG